MVEDEIVDILDAEGNVVGQVSREEAERDNHTTENVLIFIFTPSGKVWAQLRPVTKKHYPGLWDISACGGLVSGETAAEAARRETLEEMGIETELHHVESFLNIFPAEDGTERRRMSHLYIGISDQTPQLNEEVDEFVDWDPMALLDVVRQNPEKYVPSFEIELTMASAAYRKILQK